MKVISVTENGSYFDLAVASSFFREDSEFFLADDYDTLFTKIDLDPTIFGVLPVVQANSDLVKSSIKRFFCKKYKIFAEGFFHPEYSLYSTEKDKKKPLDLIYYEKSVLDFCDDLDKKYENSKLILTEDLLEEIHSNPGHINFISTNEFVRCNRLKVIQKDRLSNGKDKVQYYVVGRAFYDLPSDDSNKVILVLKVDHILDLDDIKSLFNKKDLSLLRIIKNEDYHESSFSEFYMEIEFHGLLDLTDLETIAENIYILGIIEKGKEYRI